MICTFAHRYCKTGIQLITNQLIFFLDLQTHQSWGNTVNVASRMESTGKAGHIQVVEETVEILREFGYTFEPRGLVTVKGKGKLMTYYLIGGK